jgi:hypothetical protein
VLNIRVATNTIIFLVQAKIGHLRFHRWLTKLNDSKVRSALLEYLVSFPFSCSFMSHLEPDFSRLSDRLTGLSRTSDIVPAVSDHLPFTMGGAVADQLCANLNRMLSSRNRSWQLTSADEQGSETPSSDQEENAEWVSRANFSREEESWPASDPHQNPSFSCWSGANVRDDYLDPSVHDLNSVNQDPDHDLNKTQHRTLFCFHCNRLETHSPATHFSWRYSFLIGLTLGLVKFIGPYYCRCCGQRRLLGFDRFHPYYLLHLRHSIEPHRRRKNRSKR